MICGGIVLPILFLFVCEMYLEGGITYYTNTNTNMDMDMNDVLGGDILI